MNFYENVSLSTITYYHIGGKSRYLLKVANKADLLEAMAYLHEKQLKHYLVMGLGSNIIFSDKDFDGVILWLQGDGGGFKLHENYKVEVFSGETMDALIQFSFDHGLVGLEWAGGLPSTIGGAIRGNAGAFGSEIKNTLIEVRAIDGDDPEMEIKTFSLDDIQFSYRNSLFKQRPNLIIVSAVFSLRSVMPEDLRKAQGIYSANITYRQVNHPMDYPSCGSVFKNLVKKEEVAKILSVWNDVRELSEHKWHKKVSMGYVINRLGFSGKRIGGAMVSPKHTNYIVNIDNAKAADVKALITEIQSKFEETFGFSPEPEVIIV